MSVRRLFRFAVLGPGALAASFAMPGALAADAFFDDIPIVLTASRMAQSPVDAPLAVTIIDREMIIASGFTEIHDLMRLVPGFMVADWADGSPTVANHGLGDAYDRRIKVMIDGRTVNSPLWGNTNWQDLPLRVDDLERVEVVRGPNGAAYGVNAFQAVINLITRSPSTESGARVISRLGEDGFYDHGFRANGSADGAIDWRLSGSHRRAVNFRPYRNEEGDLYPRETIARSVLNLSATAQLSTRDELGLMLGFSEGSSERGIPGSLVEPEREDDSRSNFLHLTWRRSFAADSELSLQYFHQGERLRAAWLETEEPSAVIAWNRNSDVRRDDLEIQYSGRLSPTWRFMVGAGVRQESARAPYMFNTGESLGGTSSQLFGSVVWAPMEKLKVDLGGTLEDHHFGGSLFSPRLALNYALTPESALRFSTGVSYRTPSLVEAKAEEAIYIDGRLIDVGLVTDGVVAPERVRHVELGYGAEFRELGLSLDVRAFQKAFERYIDDDRCYHRSGEQPPCPDRPQFSNVPDGTKSFLFQSGGSFRITGGEVRADWHRAGWGRVVLSQAVIDVDAGRDIVDKDFKEGAPSSITSLLLIKELPDRWRASLGFYRHSVMKWLSDGDTVPEKGRFDLKLARSFGAPGSGDEVAIVAQSLGGRYVDFSEGRYRHEPRLFASLNLSW